MPNEIDPRTLAQLVVWGGFGIGLVLGALAQATHFCTMGALADWFTYGGKARLGMWALAVAVAATGSLGLIEAGALDAARSVPWSPRLLWLSYLVGGGIFGVGMVLASGCPQRSLVKAGAGNLKSLVALLVAAVAAQMTLRGVLAVPRTHWLDAAGIDLAHPQDLGSLLGAATGVGAGGLRWIVLALLLAATVVLLWRTRATLSPAHWIGGAGVGALVVAGWTLTGHIGFIAEHPETLEASWMGTASRRPESLTFAAPLAHGLDLVTLWTDRNTVLTFGVALSLGVLLGSAVSSLWRREFRIESFRNTGDLGNHLVGGLLMGFGGVTAMGCSIGQGLSGLSLLSAGACLAVLGMVAGTWLALRWQARHLERLAA